MKNYSLNIKVAIIVSILVLSSITIFGLNHYELGSIKKHLDHIVNQQVRNLENAHRLKSSLLVTFSLRKKEATNNGSSQTLKEHKNNRLIKDELNKLLQDDHKLEDIRIQYERWIQNETNQNKRIESNILNLVEEVILQRERILNEEVNYTIEEAKTTEEIIALISLLILSIGTIASVVILRYLNNDISLVIETLEKNSIEVAVASNQIAESTSELSQANIEQSMALKQTSTSSKEFRDSIIESKNYMSEARSKVRDTHELSAQGRDSVTSMRESMENLKEVNQEIFLQIEESNKELSLINDAFIEISKKTNVINEIVFQTKLLSFNASIEAARANEHGKGFSAVASEIGILAKRSGDAAKEIEVLLKERLKTVQEIIDSTQIKYSLILEKNEREIDSSLSRTKEFESFFLEIDKNITSVFDMTKLLDETSSNQLEGINDISKALDSLEDITQINCTAQEQTSHAVLELSYQTKDLKGCMDKLSQIVKGQSLMNKTKANTETKNIQESKQEQSDLMSFEDKDLVGDIA